MSYSRGNSSVPTKVCGCCRGCRDVIPVIDEAAGVREHNLCTPCRLWVAHKVNTKLHTVVAIVNDRNQQRSA